MTEFVGPRHVQQMRRELQRTRSTVAIPRGLAAAMNATFDQRSAVFALDPEHVEMVEVARAHRAAVDDAGSGGAVTVLAPDGQASAALSELGCTIAPLTDPPASPSRVTRPPN